LPSWLGRHERGGCRSGNRNVAEIADREQRFAPVKILVRQFGSNAGINVIVSKRRAHSDMPSFLSQSTIPCIAATRFRRGLTEFSRGSLHQKSRESTSRQKCGVAGKQGGCDIS
jgi:hypothetical protein